MRICVFGAGSTGGHFAVRLARAGHDVSVVARGDHLEAIRSNGLTLRAGEEEVTAPVRASANAADLGLQDVVVVGVKATALAGMADQLPPLLGPHTRVVFPQNGMAWWYPVGRDATLPAPPDLPVFRLADLFLTRMAPEQVVGGTIFSANEVAAPGVVLNTSPGRNLLWIQSVTDPADGAVAALRAALEDSGIGSDPQRDIRETMWRKLLMNMSGSSLALATGTHSSEVREDEGLAATYRRLMEEGLETANAHGHDLRGRLDVEQVLKGMPRHKPSLLQDYERGRPMELGEIVLAPQAFARAAGIATPTLDALAAIVSRLARDRGLFSG